MDAKVVYYLGRQYFGVGQKSPTFWRNPNQQYKYILADKTDIFTKRERGQ